MSREKRLEAALRAIVALAESRYGDWDDLLSEAARIALDALATTNDPSDDQRT